MAKKKNIRKILRQSVDNLSTEISTLVDSRTSTAVEKARVGAEKVLRRNLGAALKACGIPTKDDLRKLSLRIASINKRMDKLLRRSPSRKARATVRVKRVCKVRGCNEPYRSKGYCEKHYQQWRRGRRK